jgi:hypothetical protein
MKHQIYRVQSFEIVAPYTINVTFDDMSSQTINFKPILSGEMYGVLNNLSLFNQVKIDPEIHTLVWPNGADFDPETLRNWEKYEEELIKKAEEWSASLT